MTLKQVGSIELPTNLQANSFDHAAVHQRTGRLYVAHTANDALDVVDCIHEVYLHSIPDLKGVAGVLVSEEDNLVFTSNRGENTVGIFSPDSEQALDRIQVGIRPNGLAYDPEHRLLLAANVGDPTIPRSFTLTMVDIRQRRSITDVQVPGRTRWAIFNPRNPAFYVNIAAPACMVVVDVTRPTTIARTYPIPAVGPHGLDLDQAAQRLFCACDGKTLLCLDANSGKITGEASLSGGPDVIFFNPEHQRLYVAIGDPGVIDVFDTKTLKNVQTVPTEPGAHTLAIQDSKIYAFLPQTHRAAVYADD